MTSSRARTTWSVFWAASVVVLVGACVTAGLVDGRSTAALTLVLGLVVLGIAAAVVHAAVSPGRRDDATHVPWGSTGWFLR